MPKELRIEIETTDPSVPEVTPRTLSLRDLLLVLSRFEESILAVAGIAADEADAQPPPISLLGIEAKCATPSLVVGDSLTEATDRVMQALERRDFSGVPHAAHSAVWKVSALAKVRRWRLRVHKGEWGISRDIVVSELEPVPEPPPLPSRPRVTGPTTLHGVVVSVGGWKRARVELRATDRRGAMRIDATAPKEIARKLAKRLYDHVAVSGEATWDATTGEVLDFEIREVSEYRRVPARDALAELREAIGDTFDDPTALDRLGKARSD